MRRIAVIGCSVSGGLASCYLKMRFPHVDVVVIQRPNPRHPIVGESLTEFSTQLLHEIGLGPYLEESHFHKYGLTFYFKEDIDNPADTTYATHEAMKIPPMPSNQVNRFALDRRLQERLGELGGHLVEGTVTEVALSQSGVHHVQYEDGQGTPVTVQADWVVDTSGRQRVLARQLGLKREPPFQRSAFWFRLEDFDKSILKQLNESKTFQPSIDSYYVTHHFLGRGNWIWAIPMRPHKEGCRDLISIGIVYRPDVYGREIRSVDAFVQEVGKEHAVVARLVQSGRIADTQIYRNYFYETEQSYSHEGWFIVGDAGDTVDPLYSTGMAMTSIQVKQTAALIAADLEGRLTEAYVRDLERLYKLTRDSLQREISTFYEVMHDPYQGHLRVHLASAVYFYLLLPGWLSGYATDHAGARFLTLAMTRSQPGFESLKALLQRAAERVGKLTASEIPNLYDQTVNWELFGPCEAQLPAHISRLAWFMAKVRWRALRQAGWHEWWRHLPLCVADALKASVLRVLLRGRSLRAFTRPPPAAAPNTPPAAAAAASNAAHHA
ncbi:MAG: tryptophan 7-halogenase [Pseudomonadota bacterium]